MANLTNLFDILSRALQKKVHKSLKFSYEQAGGSIFFHNFFKNRSGESDESGYKLVWPYAFMYKQRVWDYKRHP